jgi:nitrite reductase/ring-hydroxylating ferredoxin subunit
MEHLISTAQLPYPNGWFALAFDNEVRPGRVLRRRLMGEDVVVYRTRGGLLRVVSPHCPHLGAHFGHGGRVAGEDLVCPFHHFAFGPEGTCVRTGYGKKVPALRLRHRDCREVNGMIMVWRHAEGLGPQWEIPEVRDFDFPAPIRRLTVLPAYPQDINENAFDTGHFPTLHGYRSARSVSTRFDGIRSESKVLAERYFPFVGALTFPLEAEGFGVGMTHIRAHIPQLRADADSYFFSTPIEPRLMEFRVWASLKLPADARVPGGLRSLTRALSWTLTRTLGPTMRSDLDADGPVWSNKAYVDKPRLADGDGPIGLYRRWVKQFYTWPQQDQDQPRALTDLPEADPAELDRLTAQAPVSADA